MYSGKSSNSKFIPVLNYGYTTEKDGFFGYYEGGSSAIKGGTIIQSPCGSKTAATDGDPKDITTYQSVDFSIKNCTKECRLSWDCYVDDKGHYNSNNQWVFIDNIKASIAH